ncbi:hypothetical protein PU630_07770 [Microbacterium horticulturae]|uniref:Uncharacterized protein n=1 Tax=Microbacterium horticulturae TaxID=3028316 RepID=A0ABY8C206_9MICO|nr:hypothetical protein [Microbacterium sp. KACC 23027]WEG10429.1 hypothetical protein PU630_07770 [Microbacterium sp. KACC 23027]
MVSFPLTEVAQLVDDLSGAVLVENATTAEFKAKADARGFRPSELWQKYAHLLPATEGGAL